MGVQLESTGGCGTRLLSFVIKSLTDNSLTNLFKTRQPPKADLIKNLPPEIKVMILEYCDEKSLLSMRTMSQEWRDAVQGVQDVHIHPLAWAIIKNANITIDGPQASIQYQTTGPKGLKQVSTLTFIKSDGVIVVKDSKALLQGENLRSVYYLSPWWIFQKMVDRKRIWECPSLIDKKGLYFKKLVKGIKCPLLHVKSNAFGPEEYYIQSVRPDSH